MRILVVLLMTFGSFAAINAICFKPQSCTGEWDFEFCRCYPDEPTPPPTSTCPSIPNCAILSAYPTCQCTACVSDPCPSGQVRIEAPSCKCMTIDCDPSYPPPPNKVWVNYPVCDYVCDPNLPICLYGAVRDEFCRCPLACVTETCQINQYWNNSECRCVCKYPRACLYGRIWDDYTCRCERNDHP